MYIWRRLVSDIEESRQYELQSRYGVLPVTDEALSAENDVTFIQLERFQHSAFFTIWKILVALVLSIAVLGYLKMRSHTRNTFFSLVDTFCFTILGSGAFLLFSLFVLDCLLFLLFCCKIIFLFLQKDAKILHGCNSNIDHILLNDILNVLKEPRKVLFHWKKISNKLISPTLKASLSLLFTVTVTFYGLHCAHRVLKVNEIDIPIRELPSSLEQFSIVQVCDFHIGPWLWKEHVEKVVDKVNDLHPDIVVIVGDLVDLTTDKVLDAIQPLERLTSKKGIFFVGALDEESSCFTQNFLRCLKSPPILQIFRPSVVYFILVNVPRMKKNDHDSRKAKNVTRVTMTTTWAILKTFINTSETGIKVLSNESVKIAVTRMIKKRAAFIWLELKISVRARSDNQTEALVHVGSAMPVVLLTHQPSAAKQAILTDQKFDLILSGHTHGGQFFPVSLVVYLSVPYFYGLYHVKESTYLYVSSGVGFWGIPMRFMAPPEVAVLSLVTDTGSSHAAINRA
ncbi:putative transmembrane protein [Apostichopus japonicus]|uniref:Putative transmembrane protein n=1 Tax=Stichopus japonicus TaxID=307972 RepID=A0A2G8JBX6_STIJA|nr:putative transmembrane protein [Apostichopus japonicus]